MRKFLLAALLAIFLLSALFAVAALAETGSKTLPTPTPPPLKVGDATKCPVCGMDVTVSDKTPSSMYQGKTYYFCSDGDKKKFDADPTKYITKGTK